jgi:hypothetical protein
MGLPVAVRKLILPNQQNNFSPKKDKKGGAMFTNPSD